MRVLVVGLGWVATEVWLPRLRTHPAFEVVAAVEPDPARSGSAPLGVPVYADHRDVPLDGVDLVFVLTPNHTHAQIGGWFLRHGRAVLLEKPTCVHPEEIETLAAAARDGGGRLLLSAAARQRADVRALRDVVRSGMLGRPRLADLSWVRSRGIPRSAWFTRRDQAGGGVLLDLGWHVLDAVRDLWGAVRVREALAQTSADLIGGNGWSADWRGGDAPAGPGDVEDQITAFATTDRYALRMRFAWASHEERDETAIVLHGTDATAELHTTFGFSPCRRAGSTLVVKRAGQVTSIPVDDDPVGAEYDRQLDVLRTAAAYPAVTAHSLAEVRDVLAIVGACYRSSRRPIPAGAGVSA